MSDGTFRILGARPLFDVGGPGGTPAWSVAASPGLPHLLAAVGNGAVELAYQRQVSEKVALATEMQYYHNQFCQFGLGYEFKLRTAIFKGLISSDTTCTAVLEEHIQPGINLVLSGQLNHKKQDYKFGCGLTIGGA